MSRAGGLAGWLRRRDPGLAATRRAVRVALAASVGFYVSRYALDDPVMATYTLFASVALGGLSQVVGSPAERTRTYAVAGLVGAVLVMIGTWAAQQDWLAAAGMLVVGFLVAYAGVGGPRLVGVSNGLQLFYILPCFPPYAPDTLQSRLVGVASGTVLMLAADRLLWPDPGPRPFEDALAKAADAAASYAAALADGYRRERTATDVAATGEASAAAAEAVRMSRIPTMQRPASAGARDRALEDAAQALRITQSRLQWLAAQLSDLPEALPALATLLDTVAGSLRSCAAALRGTGPPPVREPLDAALDGFDASRLRRLALADRAAGLSRRLHRGATAAEATGATLVLVDAVRLVVGAGLASPASGAPDGAGLLWYAGRSAPELYWRRLSGHLTPRSVWLQNAVRVALALAAARLLAGALDLSHGFWVLLATLTMMRSSAADSRTALRPALVGTLAGAALTAVLLTVFGPGSSFYPIATPILLVLAFAAGSILGLAWGQALFTIAVAAIFTQLAPATWQLAEARFVDVLVGGLTGALIGVLAWPRGGGGELRRSLADYLETACRGMVETADVVVEGTEPHGAVRLAQREQVLASASYAQYQSERPDPSLGRVDVQATLLLAHRMLHGGDLLRRRFPEPPPEGLPGRAVVRDTVADVTAAVDGLVGGLRSGRPDIATDPVDRRATEVDWLEQAATRKEIDADVLRVIETQEWLNGLADELRTGGLLDSTAAALEPQPRR